MGRTDGKLALTQPLVSRPGYGGGSPALPRGAVSESGLPSGSPGGKGVSLNNDIPGGNTFAKPVDDVRHDEPEEGSIYRKDGPGDLAKPQNDGDERHHEQFKPTYAPGGGRDPDDVSITKYPYRDGIPNKHNASAEFVAGLYVLHTAHEIVLRAGGSFETRTAARLDDILTGLNPKVINRAGQCKATVQRADIKNLRWIFAVDCGNGVKVVKMKAVRKGNVVKLARMDMVLSCSCPAWRWLGSEHHSKREDYLDGKPRGTASEPKIKDPENINRVCKHVAAALSLARPWEIPAAKKPKGKAKTKAKTAAETFRRACGVCDANTFLEADFDEGAILISDPSIRGRALGEPEFAPAVYQLRRVGEPWPTQWVESDDLAGDLRRLLAQIESKGSP